MKVAVSGESALGCPWLPSARKRIPGVRVAQETCAACTQKEACFFAFWLTRAAGQMFKFSKEKTFRPKKGCALLFRVHSFRSVVGGRHSEGTKRYDLHKHAKATLGSGNLQVGTFSLCVSVEGNSSAPLIQEPEHLFCSRTEATCSLVPNGAATGGGGESVSVLA